MNIDLELIPTTFDVAHVGLGGLAVLLLLILIVVAARGGSSKDESAEKSSPKAQPEKPVQPELKQTTPESALQLLSLFQHEARLIDFLNEELKGFSDAEVGAAARVVHEGGQKVLAQYFSLASVRSEDEETRITLPEGFNASEVRLTGNVVGEAPFTGTLVHRGWRVTEIKLPKLSEGHDAKVIAPAEVEL